MTSTNFNVGLGDGTRASSRVLRPPGGGHTDIFGGDPEPPRGRRLVPNATAAGGEDGDFGAWGFSGSADPPRGRRMVANSCISDGQMGEIGQPMPKATNGAEAAEVPIQNGNGDGHIAEAKISPAKPESQPECPRDEARAEPPKQEAARVAEPPKRVRVPPGGFSSGLW